MTDLEVDLNILITDADPKYRSQAFQDRLRGSYKTIINSVLSPYRITLDKVNVYLSTDAETSAFSVINVESFADESESCLAVVRRSANDMALNLLFITGFADSPTTAGVSPGAGVILDAVSHATCFAVARVPYSTFFAENEDEMQATNILHEAMHFMSIPHTTETNGLIFDKIADTPECSAAIDEIAELIDFYALALARALPGAATRAVHDRFPVAPPARPPVEGPLAHGADFFRPGPPGFAAPRSPASSARAAAHQRPGDRGQSAASVT